MSTLREPRRCPCGSRQPYADCCGELHDGRASGQPTAPTAEQLMRSRFSAFAVGNEAYLLATWHRSTRPRSLQLDASLEWQRLEIRSTTRGLADDDAGTVEFDAHFWDATSNQRGLQREHSAFVREGGQWFYVGPATPE
ncbi:MAG: SEC-C domain-containing protein [Solirubrobacteraceae bacterium]|nr:SEC-C domain-containing protein [Solirubrobacteraceae bacterium]